MSGIFLGAIFSFGIVLIANALMQPSLSMSDRISPFVGNGSWASRTYTQLVITSISDIFSTRSWAPWSKNIEVFEGVCLDIVWVDEHCLIKEWN
jgi:hypothetical protein